jgi:BirA family transcriptional regulator, biotin operon repressor / biotin---[acetyl-CoA-carboxylase] ligase
VYLPECHSTNSEADKLLKAGDFFEGTVVITSNQFAGKGQRGNTWQSDPHQNITVSIILKPNFLEVKDQFFLNIISSLAISDLLLDRHGDISVKWPNDILAGTKKIAGILIENTLKGNIIHSSVVGMGININQQNFMGVKATSLFIETAKNYTLDVLFNSLFQKFENRYLQLKNNNLEVLKAEYESRLFGLGKELSFIDLRKSSSMMKFNGVIKGIDENGRMIVTHSAGAEYFQFKEVSFLY